MAATAQKEARVDWVLGRANERRGGCKNAFEVRIRVGGTVAQVYLGALKAESGGEQSQKGSAAVSVVGGNGVVNVQNLNACGPDSRTRSSKSVWPRWVKGIAE